MLTGLVWFVLTLVPLVFFQRLLHREIQAVLLILTRSPRVTVGLFSLLFLPGVMLHELSHFLMAKLLGVRTGNFSLVPRIMPNGQLILGYVETARSDYVRDSLVGIAPLVAGGTLVAYISTHPLNLLLVWQTLQNGQMELFLGALKALPDVPGFPFWFYLTFAVSSTMMPSTSDRHAWAPLMVWVGGILAVAIFAGLGPWMAQHVAPLLNAFLQSVATMFGLSAALHAALTVPLFLLHKFLAQLFRVDIISQ